MPDEKQLEAVFASAFSSTAALEDALGDDPELKEPVWRTALHIKFIEYLSMAAHGQNLESRICAIRQLSQMSPSREVSRVLEKISVDDSSPDVRREAVSALELLALRKANERSKNDAGVERIPVPDHSAVLMSGKASWRRGVMLSGCAAILAAVGGLGLPSVLHVLAVFFGVFGADALLAEGLRTDRSAKVSIAFHAVSFILIFEAVLLIAAIRTG